MSYDQTQKFPPSPYRPIVATLGAVAVVQAVAIFALTVALALRFR